MKIFHITTHKEPCGIAKYQEEYTRFLERVSKNGNINLENNFIRQTPSKNMDRTESDFKNVLIEIDEALQKNDLIHLQHEFAFYEPWQLKAVVSLIKKRKKPLVATVHTSPEPSWIDLNSCNGVRGYLTRLTYLRLQRYLTAAIRPLAYADRIIVHNSFTRNRLIKAGFDPEKIVDWDHPVYVARFGMQDRYAKEIKKIETQLSIDKDDIILAVIGFISIAKGALSAVKVLSLLPEKFKLVFLGGIHPRIKNDTFDAIQSCIVSHGLEKRVCVTGYKDNDKELDALIQRTDIVTHFYQRNYASSSGSIAKGFANHKPVVATPVRALAEINRKNIMKLTDSFSFEDMARAVREVVDDGIEKWGERSKKYAEDFSFEVFARRMLGLYQEILH